MISEQARKIIREKKVLLGDKLIILGHHYQSDEIIEFCDYTGDSLELARKASAIDKAEIIAFCGVYFMAETASILAPGKRVYIPDPSAGCPLADMARIADVERAWKFVARIAGSIIPVTYVNSSAELKAFCGKNKGTVCTSGNALKVFAWAFKKTDKIMFFPDKNLGRNTAQALGISDDLIREWDPEKINGGIDKLAVQEARVIIWKGWCPVHWPEFNISDVSRVRKDYPGIRVVVHPESDPSTVKASDAAGSTTQILSYVNSLPKGGNVAIGTEWNMVHRMAGEMQHVKAIPLKEVRCADMAKITMEKLAITLSDLGKAHEVKVPDHVAKDARVALEIMLKV